MSLQVVTMDELNAVFENSFIPNLEKRLSKQFQPKEPEEYLSKKETSSLLKVTLSTLDRWTKEGLLIAYGMGNRVYFKRSEIEATLEQNKIN